MIDVFTVQTRLTEAQARLHDLSLGKAVVEIRHGQNELLRFTPATRSALVAYIKDLEGQLVAVGALASGGRPRARRVAF